MNIQGRFGESGSLLVLRSPREIRLMRKAGLVVWKAHQAAAQRIQAGATTAEIDAAVDQVFQQHQAQPLFKGVPGQVPFPAATCVSVNEEVVHGIPGQRELSEGDIVSIDTGCRLGGWCGDAALTHAVGRVAPRAQELLDVTKQSLQLAISLLATKDRWSQVAREMAAFIRSAGFSVVEEFTGHGIGRQMHEHPKVPNFCSQRLLREDFPLRQGLVIAVEPMVNMGRREVICLADHWTQVAADGQPSAHFEHTIALTKHGPFVLTGPPAREDEELLDC